MSNPAFTIDQHSTTDTVDLTITIDAPRDVVFDFLTDPELAFRWMGEEGEIEARPGGTYRVRFTENDVAVGEFVVVDRPETVSWTWGWEGSDVIPPGSSLVTVELSEIAGQTTVTLRHTGLPSAQDVEQHSIGWNDWGERLGAAATGGNPSATDGREGSP
jgi:uncharacterized protein YndB with AHSA1/START domain